MKKLVLFLMCVFCFGNSFAQEFIPVKSVSKDNNKFYATLFTGEKHEISSNEFAKMEKQPKYFAYAKYQGSTAQDSFSGYLPFSRYCDELLAVESITENGENIEICTTDSTKFVVNDRNWLSVIKGQKVRHIQVACDWRKFERIYTVADDTQILSNDGLKKFMAANPTPEKKTTSDEPEKVHVRITKIF